MTAELESEDVGNVALRELGQVDAPTLARACVVLAELVRAEYPVRSLREIAQTWAEHATSDDLAALAEIDRYLVS